MNALDPLIEGYLDYLLHVGRKAPRSVVDVRCTLRGTCNILARLRPGVPLWKLTLQDYLQWLDQLRAAGRSSASLAKQVSQVRGLLEYAWRSGRSERNVLDGLSLHDDVQRTPPVVLTVDEAQRLVRTCPVRTPTERRDRIVILLLYGCGLRTRELCQLDVADICRERRELLVRQGKGDRDRVVPIPDAVFTELLAYLLEHGKRGALLRTEIRRTRIDPGNVCTIVHTATRRAGLGPKVTARTLRHSFATHLMDRGVDLAVIASLMGHRSPAETGVYLHVLPHRPEAAVRSLHWSAVP